MTIADVSRGFRANTNQIRKGQTWVAQQFTSMCHIRPARISFDVIGQIWEVNRSIFNLNDALAIAISLCQSLKNRNNLTHVCNVRSSSWRFPRIFYLLQRKDIKSHEIYSDILLGAAWFKIQLNVFLELDSFWVIVHQLHGFFKHLQFYKYDKHIFQR